jgi:hypothetical protein
MCGKGIGHKGSLVIETDEPPRKTVVEVCGKCVANAVLEALARRAANIIRVPNDERATPRTDWRIGRGDVSPP